MARCEGLRSERFDVSWKYTRPVMECLAPHLSEDSDERYAFLWALERVLQGRADSRDWYEGHEAARRTVSSNLGWMTSGFAAARRFSDEFGD